MTSTPTTERLWNIVGRKIPKSEAVFFSQIVILYITIITCLINLSVGNGNSNLWTALLSSCIGYMLPSPDITSKKALSTLENTASDSTPNAS